jgi:hypothetical protein
MTGLTKPPHFLASVNTTERAEEHIGEEHKGEKHRGLRCRDNEAIL